VRTLIAYATKYGATRQIAARIGSRLHADGLDVNVIDVADECDLATYDAVVICSAVYYGRWLKPAADFVRSHQQQLAALKVWLCSSGPVGDKALPEAKEIAEFKTKIRPVAHETFAGALDRTKLSFADRLVIKAVHAPDGDYRDWMAIDAWAQGIAEQLDSRVALGGTRHGN
jgi:menaquinone-dependent protoporphyrinogen oxidase